MTGIIGIPESSAAGRNEDVVPVSQFFPSSDLQSMVIAWDDIVTGTQILSS